MCRVTILNENGIPVTVEVSREIYQVFVDYEREVERQRKADFRHRDARSWDTCLIFEVSTETLEQTYERIRTLHEIQEALNEFTPKQRRRRKFRKSWLHDNNFCPFPVLYSERGNLPFSLMEP